MKYDTQLITIVYYFLITGTDLEKKGPSQNHYLGALSHQRVFEDVKEEGLIPHMLIV